MLEYRLPYNRDFSAGTNLDGRQLRPEEEVGYIDSPFSVVVPSDGSTAHPRLSEDVTFDISPLSLLFEQPAGAGVQSYVEWARPVEFINKELWGQLYVLISALPVADFTLFQFVSPTNVVGPRLVVHPNGSMQFYVGDNPVSGSTGRLHLESGTEIRVEWHIKFSTAAQGILEANFYEKYDTETQTSTEIDSISIAGVSTAFASGNRIQFGFPQGAPGNGVHLYLGGLNMNELGYMGPCLWYYDPNELGDRMYAELAPFVETLGDPGGHLLIFCRAMGRIHQPLYDIMKDGPAGEPGWSQVFDSRRFKPAWVPYSGQFVGYRAPKYRDSDDVSAYLGRQSRRMQVYSSHRRGGTDVLKEIIADQLWGEKRVIINERAGNNPDHIEVYVYASDIMAGMTTDDLKEIAKAQKAAGLIMGFTVLTGSNNYAILKAANANYGILKNKHATYQDALINTAA